MDLCSEQTEGEAAELADAFRQRSRKVKLLDVWKPQVPIWSSCHTEQDFSLGVSLPLSNWSVSGKRKSPSTALGRSAIALCIVCAFLSPQQKEDTSVIPVPELFMLTELCVLMWGEHRVGKGGTWLLSVLKDLLVQPVTNFRAVNHLCVSNICIF